MPDKQGFLACRGRAWAAEVSLPEVEGLTVTYSKSIIALGAVSIDIGWVDLLKVWDSQLITGRASGTLNF
jgi:hypothetical protein